MYWTAPRLRSNHSRESAWKRLTACLAFPTLRSASARLSSAAPPASEVEFPPMSARFTEKTGRHGAGDLRRPRGSRRYRRGKHSLHHARVVPISVQPSDADLIAKGCRGYRLHGLSKPSTIETAALRWFSPPLRPQSTKCLPASCSLRHVWLLP